MKFSKSAAQKMINSVPNWYHKIEIGTDLITPGITDGGVTLKKLDIPKDCTGKRVLDIGTRDGYFAFELEKRGAEVVAIDYVPIEKTGFHVVAELLDSKVVYIHENIYNLNPDSLGTFDIVLFLGLLYHLPDPINALNIVRSLCTDRMYLETQSIDNALMLPDGKFTSLDSISPVLTQIPLVQFYPGRSLNNDPTNYWAPNLKALEAMLSECRFTTISKLLNGNRAIVECKVVENSELDYLGKIASKHRV